MLAATSQNHTMDWANTAETELCFMPNTIVWLYLTHPYKQSTMYKGWNENIKIIYFHMVVALKEIKYLNTFLMSCSFDYGFQH